MLSNTQTFALEAHGLVMDYAQNAPAMQPLVSQPPQQSHAAPFQQTPQQHQQSPQFAQYTQPVQPFQQHQQTTQPYQQTFQPQQSQQAYLSPQAYHFQQQYQPQVNVSQPPFQSQQQTQYGGNPYITPAAPSFVQPLPATCALNNVDFSVKQGELVAIMGPSGSGKSTLLHVLAGILQPTAGSVMFKGNNITAMSDAQRTDLRRSAFGFVFQSGQLLSELPAAENIALPLMLNGMAYGNAVNQALAWLNRMGLGAIAQHKPGEMSGGQQQRVAIARALATRPQVVFADEPTGALDQRTGRDVMQLLTAVCRDMGASLVLVTHDPNVAQFCERVVQVQDGRIVSEQSYNKVSTSASSGEDAEMKRDTAAAQYSSYGAGKATEFVSGVGLGGNAGVAAEGQVNAR